MTRTILTLGFAAAAMPALAHPGHAAAAVDPAIIAGIILAAVVAVPALLRLARK